MTELELRLAALAPEVLTGLLRGIEKEGLRVDAEGLLSAAPHPAGLGSALAHPRITTDFSESQLELITGVHADIEGCLRELTELHQVVYREIGDEMLWCASMPCRLPEEERIPLARYGSSNLARMKTLYREGLSRRYGRRMQTISGIHYNFSLPEAAWAPLRRADGDTGPEGAYRDARYFALIRNFRRHSWLLLLLLGASPAVCGTFVAGREHRLVPFGAGTLHSPGATSLRMGRMGYQSDAQASLKVSFNDLAGYARSLNGALTQPYPAYEAIGLRAGGEYRQLATTLLQIENEFYGTIRPKRSIRPGERPLHALGRGGVEYVEVRLLDIDPFGPVGIDADEIRLLDLFLLHCLLAPSPPDSPGELEAMARNQRRVAEGGRDPAVRLERDGETVAPADWGGELLRRFEPIAAALDRAHGRGDHGAVLAAAQRALAEPAALPSAHVLAAMEEGHGKSFASFALAQSRVHREALRALPLAPARAAHYAALAAQSLEEQRRIEAADDVDFETYRRRYLEQDLLAGPHFRAPA
ncbi:MAG: glutamate--cysteine ligase [Burkholderiales bacterium]